ncbi:MAG: ATP-binding protein [Anaerolineales bacterium]|uniref:AlbA family DNA-binding domain-containing protein n=1 Tax=Candidatus Villigracilis proximus TaxID=3140683 RepID=UPI003134F431|nr:ATP-binding protein [Anaerolineales bacterium]
MEYEKFKKLLVNKEQTNVDFKFESHAFASKLEYPKAELVKDICAMANNGNISSYLIFGVSDDVKNFASVQNSKLTDENIQSLLKTAIYPPPTVRVFKKTG